MTVATSPPTQDINVVRGDNKTWLGTVTDSAGVAVNLTGARVRMQVRKRYDDTTALISKDSDVGPGEIEIHAPTLGKFKAKFVPADTEDLDYNDYRYDVQITISSKEKTVVRGVFNILGDVTR